MMKTKKKPIQGIINRETRAWNCKDVDVLLSIFHPHICMGMAA